MAGFNNTDPSCRSQIPKTKTFKNQNSRNPKPNFKPKRPGQGNKKAPAAGYCYVCGRDNHLAPDYFYRKTKRVPTKKPMQKPGKHQVNVVEEHPASTSSLRTQVEEV